VINNVYYLVRELRRSSPSRMHTSRILPNKDTWKNLGATAATQILGPQRSCHTPASHTPRSGVVLFQMKQTLRTARQTRTWYHTTQEEWKASQGDIVRHAEDGQVCAGHRDRRKYAGLGILISGTFRSMKGPSGLLVGKSGLTLAHPYVSVGTSLWPGIWPSVLTWSGTID
jgi:hypothetical protein